jgi:hypothetical protein
MEGQSSGNLLDLRGGARRQEIELWRTKPVSAVSFAGQTASTIIKHPQLLQELGVEVLA